jgi:predicted nucleic acid-binding protein
LTTRVLDTSVAVSWYLPQPNRAGARVWYQRLLDQEVRFLVPNLHFWELGNALRTQNRVGALEAGLAARIFDLHLRLPLRVVEPDHRTVLKTALEFSATAYDAVFISLSRELDIPLLTAEKATRPWVRQLGNLAEVVQ